MTIKIINYFIPYMVNFNFKYKQKYKNIFKLKMKSIKSIVLFILLISNILTADFLSDNSKINEIIKPLAEKVYNRFEKVVEYNNQMGIQMGPNCNNQQMGPNNNQQMVGQMGPNGNNQQMNSQMDQIVKIINKWD